MEETERQNAIMRFRITENESLLQRKKENSFLINAGQITHDELQLLKYRQ